MTLTPLTLQVGTVAQRLPADGFGFVYGKTPPRLRRDGVEGLTPGELGA